MELNYLEEIAERIRARVAPEDIPDENTKLLFRIYAVLMLAKGTNVSSADVHNAWVAWMCSADPRHAALVPFTQLTREVARSDLPYVDAIHAVAEEEGSV